MSRKTYAPVVGDVALTGEPAGRQMWYYDPQAKYPATECTFSAAENPNSADKVRECWKVKGR